MKEDHRILIIEDDQEISKLLKAILMKSNWDSVAAYSGTEGLLQLHNNTFDIILLDLMLPGKSGEEVIKEIRRKSSIPIIVISAKVDIDNKVQVLKMGADDYITKPFHQDEVLARVEVQLRKTNAHILHTTQKEWRELKINTERMSAMLKNTILNLTKAEYDILELFVNHPEYAFSKREIYEKIWTGPYLGNDNTISVHVSNLRKKFAEITSDEYITTIWGVGFMLI